MSPRELPSRPDLDQYRKQAKELLKRWKTADPRTAQKLADAQFAIAGEHGFPTWKKFIDEISRRTGRAQKTAIWKAAEDAVVTADAPTLERLLRGHEKMFRTEQPQSSWFGGLTPDYRKGDARDIIAREHCFESWEALAAFQKLMDDPSSSVGDFERAVDAVVHGDAERLQALLRQKSHLIQARSMRSHHSQLLHYVGANGVESWRQRPSKNAVRIAEILLDAGAEIDATADMYKGGCTTFGLVATSIHPKTAGVLRPLIELFLSRGARIDLAGAGNAHSFVNGCLANGRPEAAEYLASLGAPLDLEGAAGVGRLDLVQSYFDARSALANGATAAQRDAGFTWACEYGRTTVVEFLLDHGVDVNVSTGPHKQTGLHWAATGGHLETVQALLKRRPRVDIRDASFGGTPLNWAIYGWSLCRDDPRRREPFYTIVALLVAAGAPVDRAWLTPEHAAEDPRMYAALAAGGEPRNPPDSKTT
jgi:Ankyrin repeats (3 copies)